MANATPEMLLSHLPPYQDHWVLIHPDQSVRDIVREVLDAHKEFAPYYDQIGSFFNDGTTAEICQDLYNFCKNYIHYREETEDVQTSALPTGILTRGYGDCKHYAGFCGGIIDALNREGRRIPWAYCFASYDVTDPVPHHVFIVVNPGTGKEIWLDPTPGSGIREPIYRLDKKVSGMALHRNIAGTGAGPASIGLASRYINLNTSWQTAMNFAGAPWPAAYGNPFAHYLGYDYYRDYGGDRDINEADLANRLNQAIANGPSPGHTITPDFAKWVYDNSIRSWNFFYPGGVDPSFKENPFIPASFSWINSAGQRQTISPPHFVVTADHRVTFDHDVKLDDYENWLIHLLTAAAQNYINQYDATGFPLKPADLKLYSQAYTGNPNNPAASILHEWRGSSDVAKFVQTTTSIISNTIIKIAGAIPRNAFLALIGINLFHMATDLQNSINAGHWGEISDRWKQLGGDPDKLLNTISHGSGQPETDDTTGTINSGDQISGSSIGNPAVIGAVIAAATPIIVALANYFSHSSVKGIATGGVTALNNANPAGNYSLTGNGLMSNGQPVTFQSEMTGMLGAGSIVWPIVAAAGTYYLMNRKKGPGRKKQILIPVAAGLGVYLFQKYKAGQWQTPTNAPLSTNTQTLPQAQTPAGVIPQILTAAEQIFNASQGGAAVTPTSPVTAGGGVNDTGAGSDFSLAGVPYAVGM